MSASASERHTPLFLSQIIIYPSLSIFHTCKVDRFRSTKDKNRIKIPERNMENPTNTRKQGKNKMPVNISGGGGLGGVFVLGGVAAIATIVSYSANRIRRKGSENTENLPRTPPPSPEPIENLDQSTQLDLNNTGDQGLCVILKESSSPTYCHPRDEAAEKSAILNDPKSLAFTEGPFHVEKSTLDTSGRNENPSYMDILLSDNAKTKDIETFTNNGGSRESSKDNMKTEVPPCNEFEEVNSRRESIGKELEEGGRRLSGLENTKKRDEMNQFAGKGNQDIGELLQKPRVEEAVRGVAGQVEGQNDSKTKPVEEEPVEENSEVESSAAQEDRSAIESDKEEIEVVGKDSGNVSTDEVVAEEETPQSLTEEENNDEIDVDDYDDEETSNKSEAGSDRTEGSSVESTIDAIWPEESIDELATEIKEFKINDQEREETADKNRNFEQKEYVCYDKIRGGNEKNIKELLERNNLSTASRNLSIRTWSIAAVPLMLAVVMVALNLQLSPSLVGKLCLVFVVAGILSKV